MAKFSNSRTLRLKIWAVWKRDNHGYSDFEEFYDDVMDMFIENLVVFIETADIEK